MANSRGDGSHPNDPNQDSISELAAESLAEVRTEAVIDPGAISATNAAVFVVTAGSAIAQVDGTAEATTLIAFPPERQVIAIATSGGRVWISTKETDQAEGSLATLDASTGLVLFDSVTQGTISMIVAGKAAPVAVLQPVSGSWQLGAIDDRGFEPIASLPPGVDAETLAVSDTFAWLAGSNDRLLRIRLRDGAESTFAIGEGEPIIGLAAASDTEVWALGSTTLRDLSVRDSPP